MRNIFWYDDLIQKEIAEHNERLAIIKLYKPLIQIAMEYGCRFSHNHEWTYPQTERAFDMTFALGTGVINCLAVNLRLAKDDSIIKDIGPIIEELKEHPRLVFQAECDYIAAGWKGWDFKLDGKWNGHIPILKVRAFFENTNKCRKVGTGEFEEIMKVECEE